MILTLSRRLASRWLRFDKTDAVRASLGALAGILVTGMLTRAALGDSGGVPMLIAPMGASAVLLFAASHSPLAQPWSLLGGNLVASLAGVTVAMLVPDPIVAAAVGLACAIALMCVLGCLHPPSGAVALTAVLGGPAIRDLGYLFVLWPVAINSIALLCTAYVYNNFAGRSYPEPKAPPSGQGNDGSGIDDVRSLHHFFEQATLRALPGGADRLLCADVMSPVTATVAPSMRIGTAWRILQREGLRCLPVLNENGELVGILSRTDFFDARVVAQDGRAHMRLPFGRGRFVRRVSDIMTANVQSALPGTPLIKLVGPMVDQGLHQVPVVSRANRPVGMVTQRQLLAGLFPASATGALAEQNAGRT